MDNWEDALEGTATALYESAQDFEHNWHPGVHTRFGEKLYFYLLRLKSPLRANEVEGRIRNLLDAADVKHACEYAVYGDWDVLIRVWLSPSWKKQFLSALNRADDTSTVRAFEANELRYLWAGSSADLLAPEPEVEARIAENLGEIRNYAEGETKVDAATREALTNAGLLLPRSQTEGADPVKFYICLKIYGDLSRAAEVDRVLTALDNAGLSERATLYSGIGSFADHLVKCVAHTYSEVMTLNASLSEALQDLDMRPMTLLVANSRARESDNINDVARLTAEDDVVLGLLKLDAGGPALLAGLPPAQRQALHALVEDVYRRSVDDLQLREKLRDLLRASLENNFDEVRNTLVFLLDLEAFLTDYLVKRAWPAGYGPDWTTALAQELEEADEGSFHSDLLRKIDKWTLADCVKMAVRSAEVNADVNLQITKDLDSDWKPQMYVLKRIRNAVAHRELRETGSFDEFTGEWGQTLTDLMTAASMHFKLERLVKKEDPDR